MCVVKSDSSFSVFYALEKQISSLQVKHAFKNVKIIVCCILKMATAGKMQL